MSQAAKESSSTWWDTYSKAARCTGFMHNIALESEATHIRHFSSLVIPGLLQTEEFMRALYRDPLRQRSQRELTEKKFVELRIARQWRIFEQANPPLSHFILDSNMLLRSVQDASVLY
ncbi:MAG: Scr1 family TA system antitoxin-like transcriptional regulator, partial [Patescibacteria group bacterium]